jgi:hypothetical protein
MKILCQQQKGRNHDVAFHFAVTLRRCGSSCNLRSLTSHVVHCAGSPIRIFTPALVDELLGVFIGGF